jgi:hypothetical protein
MIRAWCVGMTEPEPTPESDRAEFHSSDARNVLCVRSEFARQLERRLAAANRRIAEWRVVHESQSAAVDALMKRIAELEGGRDVNE